MIELKVGNECFHLLFADTEDVYFTDHWLKLSFEQRLYQVMKQNAYEEVYFFRKVNGHKSEILCATENEAEQFRECAKEPLNEDALFFKNKVCDPFKAEGGCIRLVLSQDNKIIRGTIAKLIRRKDKDNCGFIFLDDSFSQVYPSGYARQQFREVLKDRSKSLFLLCCGREQDQNAPELSDLLQGNDKVGRTVWEPLEREQLKRMLGRVLLNDPGSSMKYVEKNAKALHEQLLSQRGFLGHRIERKKELYDLLQEKENLKKLKEMVKAHDI